MTLNPPLPMIFASEKFPVACTTAGRPTAGKDVVSNARFGGWLSGATLSTTLGALCTTLGGLSTAKKIALSGCFYPFSQCYNQEIWTEPLCLYSWNFTWYSFSVPSSPPGGKPESNESQNYSDQGHCYTNNNPSRKRLGRLRFTCDSSALLLRRKFVALYCACR